MPVPAVSGQSFENTWSRSRADPAGDDGNSTYITWQPSASNAGGCTFNSNDAAASPALNGNWSRRIGCTGGNHHGTQPYMVSLYAVRWKNRRQQATG